MLIWFEFIIFYSEFFLLSIYFDIRIYFPFFPFLRWILGFLLSFFSCLKYIILFLRVLFLVLFLSIVFDAIFVSFLYVSLSSFFPFSRCQFYFFFVFNAFICHIFTCLLSILHNFIYSHSVLCSMTLILCPMISFFTRQFL